jgi:hypothetical protein
VLDAVYFYDLVAVICRNVSEGGTAVCHVVFEPALDALIGLNNVVSKVIPVVYKHAFSRAEYAFTLASHPWHCEEVEGHNREGRIGGLANISLLAKRLFEVRSRQGLALRDLGEVSVVCVLHKAL